MNKDLERQFDRAMISMYERALIEYRYKATRRWTSIYELSRIEKDEWDMRKGEIKPKLSGEAE